MLQPHAITATFPNLFSPLPYHILTPDVAAADDISLGREWGIGISTSLY